MTEKAKEFYITTSGERHLEKAPFEVKRHESWDAAKKWADGCMYSHYIHKVTPVGKTEIATTYKDLSND